MLKKMVQFQLVFFVAVCLFLSFGNSQAYAAGYADCSAALVTMVGPTPAATNNVAVFLQNKTAAPVGTWQVNEVRMFQLYEPISNKGLAVVLTAFTMDKTVNVRVEDSNAIPGSLISYIYLKK